MNGCTCNGTAINWDKCPYHRNRSHMTNRGSHPEKTRNIRKDTEKIINGLKEAYRKTQENSTQMP